ncbi:MAG: diadenylate cyclase CdaA [Elusimicrobiales bacterium]|nr:diadenylate cyclase CdaA [Elusimicrobiales bacterium]
MFSLLANLADLFLIYFIYYRLLVLFSSSRANKVIVGIMVLGATTILAQYLHLTATAWIMRQVWLAGALALVIVFQPEIRRGLMTVGTLFSDLGGTANPIGRFFAVVSGDYSFIPPMIEAIKTASEQHVGMLIVLEQDQNAKDIITDGTALDAMVSKELLLTIFFDKTLLHDGAVLISNNRVALAAGVLPLTEQNLLSKDLGTRHRAALGMSENSDAIILVVSEQTGQVSMARNRMLQRINNLHDLEARLNDLYKARSKRSLLRKPEDKSVVPGINPIIINNENHNNEDRRGEYKKSLDIMAVLKDFFLNPPDVFKVNWHLKLFAFGLSVITYLYVLGSR